MLYDQKTWNSLKTMGLTDYEATTYLALTSMISGTATESITSDCLDLEYMTY